MVLKRGLLVVMVQVFQLVAIVGTTVLVTRVTGAHGRGIYSLMGTLATATSMIFSLGIIWAGIHYIGRKLFPIRDVVATLLTSTLASAGLSALALSAAYALAQHSYFREVTATQLVLSLLLMFMMQLATATSSIVLGFNKPIHFASVSLTQLTVTLIIQLSLALAGALTPTTALAAWAAGAAVSAVLGFVLVSREAPVSLGFDRKIFQTYLSFGAKGYIANTLMFFNYRLDALIVNGILGVVSVGYYSISVAMAEVLWYVANAFSLVMFPHISSLDRKEADRLTPVVCRNTLFVTLLAAIGMFAVGRALIVAVFGPAMLPAALPLWLLLPGIVTLSAAKVISSYLSGIGKPIYSTQIAAVTVVLTVVLDLVLIPRYGIAGAALASSVIYTSATVLSITFFMRESHNSLWATILIRPEDLVRYRQLIGSAFRMIASLRPVHS